MAGNGVDGVVDRGGDGGAVGRLDFEGDVHLHDRFEVGDLQGQRFLIGGKGCGFDFNRIAADLRGVCETVILGAIFGRPAIVPLLDAVVVLVTGGGAVERVA